MPLLVEFKPRFKFVIVFQSLEAEAGSSSAGRLDVCQGRGKEMESEVNRPWETDMLTLLNFQ